MKTVSKNTRKKIREEILRIEDKKGPLTQNQKRRIEKNVIQKEKRKNSIRAILVALGITTVGVSGYLASGNNQQKIDDNKQITENQIDETENKRNDFVNTIKIEDSELNKENTEKQVDYEQIISNIIEEYNEQNDTKITEEDISYMKSNPQFLGIDENGTYVQDYKENTPVQEYVTKGIKDVYVMVNNENDTIITSLGKVDDKIANIDTKILMDKNRKEYIGKDKKIDLTENQDEKTIEQRYETLQNEYEKEIEEQR